MTNPSSGMRSCGSPAMSLIWNLDNSPEAEKRLSVQEAYRIGWALAWPVLLFNLLFWELEALFEISHWAATAMQSANAVLVAFGVMPKAIARAIQTQFPRFHLAVRRRETQDLSRTLSYRERLKLSIRMAVFTGGLALLPLAWLRSLLTAGQDTGQLILNGILGLVSVGLPLWAAAVLLSDISNAFSLRVVREDSKGQGL